MSEKKSALQRIVDTLKENVAPGKILGDIAKEVDNQVAQGSHELASAILRGDAFVMYPRSQQGNDQETTLDKIRGNMPAMEQPEQQKQQERGGMEM
ncbi:MAG TPA: hypothetical protein VFE62_09665 [Gemmataceae bacterium]|nr:hypothetical protein [Gemmataceae bacterium]